VSQINKKTATTTRIYALDALRASIMILGVFLHGAVPYMQVPMPGLLWPVTDPSAGWVYDSVLWYIHGFRIPLFFLIAGFFSAMLYDLRGPQGFLLHRFRRVGIPLVMAIVVILPPTYYLWSWGLVEQDILTWREVWRFTHEDRQIKNQLLGLAHLWFLQYLLIYYLLYYLLRSRSPALLEFPKRIRLLERWWWPLTLVAVTFPLLWLRPEIYTYYDNRWMPEPWGLLYYAVFYLVGSHLYRVRDQLQRLIATGPYYIIASLVIFTFLFQTLKWQLTGDPASQDATWFFALATALYSWLAVWGFLGVCLMVFSRVSPRLRFMSDSAYWIYLVHLPLVGLMHLLLEYLQDLGGFSIPSSVGFIVSVSATLAISLLSYKHFVRCGAIGKWLHGPKEKVPLESSGPRGFPKPGLAQHPSGSKETGS